jgi:ferrous iron transport protein A
MLIPLDMLKPGEHAHVVEVYGDAAWVGRLAEMGLREGCKLQVLQPGSPCLLQVSNCKLCLRGCESSQIMVQPVLPS